MTAATAVPAKSATRTPQPPTAWSRKHLLGLEDLSRGEIELVLDRADGYVGVGEGGTPKRDDLKGKVVANIFYEPSTRTRTSFGLAARRLGADTVDFTPGGSSISKGESFIDTAKNIEAMGVDVVVVRHASPGAPHLLGLEELSRAEIETILDTAEPFVGVDPHAPKRDDLKGRQVASLFFEPSTRTRMSFGLAARRLSADTLDFTPSSSSLSKGETFIDTAKNIEAMGVDVMVVRHPTPGAPHLLSKNLACSIINAGDGAHEHPTQGLLDIFTIRKRKGRIAGLTVGLIGDIAHSRVARSNIHALVKLGARVIVCGPPTLVPAGVERLGVEVAYRFDDVLPECDVLNLLRVQFERQRTGLFPSVGEYARLFGMDGPRLRKAKADVLLLAPGPINRGVEVTPEVADGPHSAILQQVTNGLAVRMAVLHLLCGQPSEEH